MSDLKQKRKLKQHWVDNGHSEEIALEYSYIHKHNRTRIESFNAGNSYQSKRGHIKLESQAKQNALDAGIDADRIKNLEDDNNYLKIENEKLWQIIANLKLKQENDKNRN